jgi:hypothetical protein
MADPQLQEFGKRLSRINRHHEKLAQGYVNVVSADGLMVSQPRRQQLKFPWRILAVIAALFFVFKGLLMAGLGEEEFAARAFSLQAGTPVEQVGGWVMQPDPLTVWVANQVSAKKT